VGGTINEKIFTFDSGINRPFQNTSKIGNGGNCWVTLLLPLLVVDELEIVFLIVILFPSFISISTTSSLSNK
jgi:hypothetical protein